jgi:hypothetical protein
MNWFTDSNILTWVVSVYLAGYVIHFSLYVRISYHLLLNDDYSIAWKVRASAYLMFIYVTYMVGYTMFISLLWPYEISWMLRNIPLDGATSAKELLNDLQRAGRNH